MNVNLNALSLTQNAPTSAPPATPAPAPAAPPIDIHETGTSVDDLPSRTLGQRIGGLDLTNPTFLKTVGLMEAAGTVIGAVGGTLLGNPVLGAAIGAGVAATVLTGYGLYAGSKGGNDLEHPEKYD